MNKTVYILLNPLGHAVAQSSNRNYMEALKLHLNPNGDEDWDIIERFYYGRPQDEPTQAKA